MRIFWLAGLGAAAYALFLVGTMPASFLLAQARASQPGKFDVHEAQGSAWRGRARVTVHTPGGPVAVDDLSWRLLPTRLATGRVAFSIEARAAGLEARYEGGRSITRWDVRDLGVRGSAAAMVTLLPWLSPWRPEGEVTISSPRLDTDGQELRGEARVEWRGASVGLSDVRPLGSYRADIRAEGHAGSLKVTTLDGPLRITGQGMLTPPTRLDFTGEARAEGDAARALAPLLDLLGPARPDGARSIAWQVR
ncbi:MAG TPA: type II secretion system protein N [Usitatibacter sp.]|nr:type II secretion system protein N [Usitatibacter sp.]